MVGDRLDWDQSFDASTNDAAPGYCLEERRSVLQSVVWMMTLTGCWSGKRLARSMRSAAPECRLRSDSIVAFRVVFIRLPFIMDVVYPAWNEESTVSRSFLPDSPRLTTNVLLVYKSLAFLHNSDRKSISSIFNPQCPRCSMLSALPCEKVISGSVKHLILCLIVLALWAFSIPRFREDMAMLSDSFVDDRSICIWVALN